jgi:serine/threonine protein kinase
LPAIPGEQYDFLDPAEEADELGRLGPYRILDVLGTGGMGLVFLAEDPQLKRKVALKVMPPVLAVSESARRRFLREAQAAAAIAHDHIVTVHHVGEARGLPFIAMQYLKGETLDTRLQREPQLPILEVLRIGREIAAGLSAAHEQELIHRDIKPANIWLEAGSNRVKILDFGLARAAACEPQLTQVGTVAGTPAFMAPEQARNLPIDGRSDLFSLGCVLYLMVTGQQPFFGTESLAMMIAVVSDEPLPPRDVRPDAPHELSNLILRLLAKEPAERLPTARAVIETIEAVQRSLRPDHNYLAQNAISPQWSPFATKEFVVPKEPRITRALASRKSRRKLRTAWLTGAAICLLALAALPISRMVSPQPPKPGPVVTKQPIEPESRPLLAIPALRPSEDRVRKEADRIAAEWALRQGGSVSIVTQEAGSPLEVTAMAGLPPGRFWTQRIHLAGHKGVTDAGLEHLEGLTRLQMLWLPDTAISDAGLMHLKGLTGLLGLNLCKTAISEQGLVSLKDLTDLQFLHLSATRVSDASLTYLEDHKKLKELNLSYTGVSDAGLKHLERMTALQALWLQGTRVSDGAVATLEKLPGLQMLYLEGAKISQEGVKRLKASLPRCNIVTKG